MSTFEDLRTMMVDTQIRPSDVTKYPVIAAMLDIPREAFVPDDKRDVAYAGRNLNLSDGRVILDPRTFAKMLDAVNPQVDEAVLDLGCGLGYSAAVLARLCDAVVAVEEPGMAEEAQANLSEHGFDNAAVIAGELAEGAAKAGPYDVILIEGGVEVVPDALLDQLNEGGRIAALFVEGALGVCWMGVKSGGQVSWRREFEAAAPVLAGFAKTTEFAL